MLDVCGEVCVSYFDGGWSEEMSFHFPVVNFAHFFRCEVLIKSHGMVNSNWLVIEDPEKGLTTKFECSVSDGVTHQVVDYAESVIHGAI